MAWSSGLQLRVIEGKNRGRTIELDQQEYCLGRAATPNEAAEGHIFFQEPTVSRVHALLTWHARKKKYLIQHKSRTNPTRVNGKDADKKLLDVGCTVQMGLLVLRLEKAEPKKTKPRSRPNRAASPAAPKAPTSVVGPILEVLGEVERQRRTGQVEQPRKTPARIRNESEQTSSFGWEPPPPAAPPSNTNTDVFEPIGGNDSSSKADYAFHMFVADGPDKGMSFNLEGTVIVIGRRDGFNDPRTGNVILLNDQKLPPEQALLVWKGREGTFGIHRSDRSELPLMVRRVASGSTQMLEVDAQSPTLLQEGDIIQMGVSSLMLRRAGSTAEPPPASPPPEKRAPAEKPAPPKAEPTPPRRNSIALDDTQPGFLSSTPPPAREEPRPSPFKSGPSAEPELVPPSITPVEAQRQSAAAAADDLEETMGGIVPRGAPERLLRGRPGTGGEELMGPPPGPAPGPAPTAPSVAPRANPLPPTAPAALEDTLGAKETMGRAVTPGGPRRNVGRTAATALGLNWPWKKDVDFVFDFISGPNHGCQIALTEAELPPGRSITMGASGDRMNDVVLDSVGVANRQVTIRFQDKRFTLLNEGQSGSVLVNQVPLKSNDQVVLLTGDHVEIGDTIFRFLERHTVEVLARYRLITESGVTADQDKSFAFTKQRVVAGRGKHCDVRLCDLEVSRIHVSIVYRDGQFYISHRSETNPTFLNGVSLLHGAERALNPGDRIRLSSLSVLRFLQVEPPAQGAPRRRPPF